MTQIFPRFCPRCCAATLPSSTVCVKCGLNLVERISHAGVSVTIIDAQQAQNFLDDPITFLIPQNATALTLTLLPQNQSGFKQATIDFQLA